VEAARSLVLHREHDLSVALPTQPVFVNADPVRLAQVVSNLVDNACKFTDKGGQIRVSVEVEDIGKPMAVIRVRDSGVGITAEQMPRIFDMFVQLDTSLERSVSGLGIGLTLVKNLMELHGGTVAAHSAGAGQGSEFVVRLPIAGVAEEPPPEPLRAEPSVLANHRILVADDNRDAATSLALLLQLNGNETHTAHDGQAAVEAAAKWKPDVALLDIGMPKLNGHDAARRIREQPWGKAMVLVALTGWGQEEDLRRSRESGFDGHMVKPVDLDALVTLLTGLLPPPTRPEGRIRG
jgi:CheY-like chemotaxis protein